MFGLKRTLTLFHAVALGVGALIGAGIFVLIGPAMELAGAHVIWVYVVAGLSAFLSALTYAELSSTYLDANGEYALTKEIMNERMAFMVAWMLITASMVACAVYALGFGAFMSLLVPLPQLFWAYVILAVLCYINFRGVEKTATFEYYVTIFLVFALSLVGSFFFYHGDFRTLFVGGVSDKMVTQLFQAIGLVYISFYGFQVIASSSAEMIDPRKNLPRAMLMSISIAFFIYIFLVTGVVVTTNGQVVGDPARLLDTLFSTYLGWHGSVAILILGLLATVTSLNATILAISRRILTVAQDRYVPELLARVHPKFSTPHGALMFLFVVAGLLMLLGDLSFVASLSGLLYLVSLTFVHGLMFVSHKKDKKKERGFRSPLFPIFPVLGILTNLVVLFFSPWQSLTIALGWSVFGLFVFSFLKKQAAGLGLFRLLFERVKLRITRPHDES